MADGSMKGELGDEHAKPPVDRTHASYADEKATLRTETTVTGVDEGRMKPKGQKGAAGKAYSIGSMFAIPSPLKRLFDEFPLVTYAENSLPIRSHRSRKRHVLYIFTRKEDEASERPSFNPSCLKWQTCLKIAGIEFSVVSSNNHASPSGALPFLLTSSDATAPEYASSVPEAVSSSRLKKWMKNKNTGRSLPEPRDVRYEAYNSLLDSCIRRAWLYQLYLLPANESVVKGLYIQPCSSNPIVQMAIAAQLRSAAAKELIKSTGRHEISEADIMHEAEAAFESLSTLLGNDEWILSKDGPTLFDASLFAYTHLILDDLIEWNANPLGDMLRRCQTLVGHQRRIRQMYY